MRVNVRATVFVAAALMGGCAGPTTKYYWGAYEPALYQYYKTPAKVADLEAELARGIQQAAEKGQKVPPGIYAEYGFVLQQQGKVTEAATYYEKERQAWPESAVLMNAMLDSLGKAKRVDNKESQK